MDSVDLGAWKEEPANIILKTQIPSLSSGDGCDDLVTKSRNLRSMDSCYISGGIFGRNATDGSFGTTFWKRPRCTNDYE
jgi:hypothetical protein